MIKTVDAKYVKIKNKISAFKFHSKLLPALLLCSMVDYFLTLNELNSRFPLCSAYAVLDAQSVAYGTVLNFSVFLIKLLEKPNLYYTHNSLCRI